MKGISWCKGTIKDKQSGVASKTQAGQKTKPIIPSAYSLMDFLMMPVHSLFIDLNWPNNLWFYISSYCFYFTSPLSVKLLDLFYCCHPPLTFTNCCKARPPLCACCLFALIQGIHLRGHSSNKFTQQPLLSRDPLLASPLACSFSLFVTICFSDCLYIVVSQSVFHVFSVFVLFWLFTRNLVCP